VLERYSLEWGSARRASTRLAIPLVLEVNAPLALEAARYRGLTNLQEALDREQEALETADAVVVVSSALETYVRERVQTRVVRVPNGVDIDRFGRASPRDLGLAIQSIAVGFVGSMKRWHGVRDLLEAFRIVVEHSADAHLILVGSGPEDEMVKVAAESPPLRGRIHVLGPVAYDSIPDVLASLSIAVAPYPLLPDFYFSPLKVMEYMAAGVPIVFSDVGDLSQLVGPAGIACSPGDAQALARALLRLIEDPDLRRRLATAGQIQSQGFTWGAAAAKVELVLREAISVPARRD
jgi:glycosyltransferase involved in cell wall biosynthesis